MRLRRAAENGVFVILGSSAMLGPVVQWNAGHGTTMVTGSDATSALATMDMPPEKTPSAPPASSLSPVHRPDLTVLDLAQPACTRQPVAKAPISHVLDHCRGDQVRQLLDEILEAESASAACSPQDTQSPKDVASFPDEPLTVGPHPHTGMNDLQKRNVPTNEANIVCATENATGASLELESRLWQIQQGLAEVDF